MITALNEVLEQDISALEGKRLDRDFFNGLLTSGDLTRDVLTWIDQGDAYAERIGPAAWGAFSNICASQLDLDPKTAGLLTGAEKLAGREGQWGAVWERFCEAPQRYPNIPDTLRRCQMPSFDLLSDISTRGAWPQWNDAEEASLRQKLLALGASTDAQARTALKELEKTHAARRTLVWAEMGQAQLAKSLKHLAVLAKITKQSLAGGTLDDVETSYTTGGWKADDAVLSALQEAHTDANATSVIAALRSIYLPWDKFQKKLNDSKYENISPSVLLQILSLIISDSKECKRKTILGLDKADIIASWDGVISAIEKTIDHFRTVLRVPVSQILPYDTLIVPFAYFFLKTGKSPNGQQRKHLEELFWRSSLSLRYSSATESKLAADIKKVDLIIEGKRPLP